jgi:hypothetical protein
MARRQEIWFKIFSLIVLLSAFLACLHVAGLIGTGAPSLRSYWPTEIRVDTDMDSYWLPDEERICQTHPDEDGRVSVVACNASGSHRIHNIPVTFWGDPSRNVVSDWKCRRERDKFVCRATD